jgi:two-component system cell cycle sensor histidine kinase/response regulator CckA
MREEHFRSIVENVCDVITVVQPDGLVTYTSPAIAHVLGYRQDVLAGTPFVDVIHPDDAKGFTQFLARQIADRDDTQTIEIRVRHADGTYRSFEVLAGCQIDDDRVTAIVMTARDITQRKLLQTELAQSNRVTSLGRLGSTLAHEFNNVLMGMQPFAELMQRPNAQPSMIAKGAWHISNSIQRGKRITLDILRFTQSAAPVTAPVDLREWWETYAPEAEVVIGNSIQLKSNLLSSNASVIADRTQLSQIMSNLISNARDAMPAGGTLTVRASEPDTHAHFAFGVVPNPDEFVHISVTDTGCGMAPEVMDRAFEPLFTTKQTGGTGLGLAIAHQAVGQHRGHIFVESAPGVGTTFHLFFPKAKEPAAPADLTTVHRPRPQRLLMIEDETSIVEGVSALLSIEGMEVQAIGLGAQSEEAITSFAPDVVLLDFGLPDMDGAEVYARIRKIRPDLPVIFATGHADCRFILDGQSDSHTRFLRKPFEMSSLLEIIEELQSPGALH